MSQPKRNIYVISWNDNRGFYGRSHLLAYDDAEAFKRFREHHNVDDKSSLSIELVAKEVRDIIV